MRKLWPAVLILLLAGCSDDAPVKSGKTRAVRIAEAEAAVSKSPVPRTYQVGEHQLLVIEVPARDSRGFVENQRCFIWRDAEYKSASIQCPADAIDPLPLVGPEDDKSRY